MQKRNPLLKRAADPRKSNLKRYTLMTDEQKITTVKVLVENDPEATDAVVGVYLDVALSAILDRRYPFGVPETYDVSQYDMLQCKLAARYFLRRGAEGETSHNENGVNRTYGSVNDEDLLDEVIVIAKVM